MLLDAACDILRDEGLQAVTARAVAARLGCSTAPVFTHFSAMDDLHEQVLDRAMGTFVDHVRRPQADDPLRSVALGWISFAIHEPRVYAAIFLTPHPWYRKWGRLRRQLAEAMSSFPRYAPLDGTARFALVGRASIVLHGIGIECWSGRLDARHPNALLDAVLEPIIASALHSPTLDDLHSSTPSSPPSETEP